MSRKAALSDEMQQCAQLLKYLQNKPEAEPFLEPVDWEGLGLPDYPEIIKNPMDLHTIQETLHSGKYSSVDRFAADVRQVWVNAKTYNRADSAIYVTADNLSKLFEKRLAKLKRPGKRKRSDAKADQREAGRQDRVKFSQLINQLTTDQLGKVVAILQQRCPESLNEEDDDELEIEINVIDPVTLLQLNQYCTECTADNAATKKKRRS